MPTDSPIYEWLSPDHARLRGWDIHYGAIRAWYEIEHKASWLANRATWGQVHTVNQALSTIAGNLQVSEEWRMAPFIIEGIQRALTKLYALGLDIPARVLLPLSDKERGELLQAISDRAKLGG